MADGRCGQVISENESITELYAKSVRYEEGLEFEIHPLPTIQGALQSLMNRYIWPAPQRCRSTELS